LLDTSACHHSYRQYKPFASSNRPFSFLHQFGVNWDCVTGALLQSQLFNTQTTLLQVGHFDPSYLGEFRALTHLNSSAFAGDLDAPVTGVVWGTDFWELGDFGIN
jgi:hypothetical protein